MAPVRWGRVLVLVLSCVVVWASSLPPVEALGDLRGVVVTSNSGDTAGDCTWCTGWRGDVGCHCVVAEGR